VSESSRRLLQRAWRAASEEVSPVLSRQLFAHLSRTLPSSAFSKTRTALFRAAGVRIAEHSFIQGGMRLTGPGNPCKLLTIGEHTLITGGLHIDLGAAVHIGNWVRIGHDVTLLTINHALGASFLRAGTSSFEEIVIEDGAWIASRCTVLPGVTVGRGAIVAAGAVVTRDVPPNTLVAGVPARVLRALPEAGDDPEADALRARAPETRH
jgi:acetyltransferase-like isoleucine patch superfamily enzyme